MNNYKRLGLFFSGLLVAMANGGRAQGATNTFPTSGNVGIGTLSPRATLTVQGPFSTFAEQTAVNAITFYPNHSDSNAIYSDFWSGTTALPLTLGAYPSTQAMTILTNGNIGIGSATPASKLTIMGEVFAHSGSLVSDFPTPEGGNLRLFNTSKTGATTNNWTIYNMTGSYGNGLAFWRYYVDGTNAGPSVWFADSGNVGIGTTNPTQKLSVSGTIQAKEVIVQTGWSDYVFAKDYPLAPLGEVEREIQRRGHLPGVPSAKEVAEKGVSLGNMQALLLAKIEELTLHQIEQEKELTVLRAKVFSLENVHVRTE